MAKIDLFEVPAQVILKLPINYDGAHWTTRREAREEYIKIQGGKCCHCGTGLYEDTSHFNMGKIDKSLFPDNFFSHPIHLHHSHETGLTIGAVHSYCNAILWQYYGE